MVDLDNMTYSRNGRTFNITELGELSRVYNQMITAEYLMEARKFPKEKAWTVAGDVRELMAKYELTESEALEEVLQ